MQEEITRIYDGGFIEENEPIDYFNEQLVINNVITYSNYRDLEYTYIIQNNEVDKLDDYLFLIDKDETNHSLDKLINMYIIFPDFSDTINRINDIVYKINGIFNYPFDYKKKSILQLLLFIDRFNIDTRYKKIYDISTFKSYKKIDLLPDDDFKTKMDKLHKKEVFYRDYLLNIENNNKNIIHNVTLIKKYINNIFDENKIQETLNKM